VGRHLAKRNEMRVPRSSRRLGLRTLLFLCCVVYVVSNASVRTDQLEGHIKQTVVRKHNKPRPRVAHRGIARFLGLFAKNVIRSSHGHSAPSLNISCKSVQPFSRNLANKETKKDINKDINRQTNKEIDRKQYPVPRCIGDGVKIGRSSDRLFLSRMLLR